jgi:type II protein arginine methyltransferase
MSEDDEAQLVALEAAIPQGPERAAHFAALAEIAAAKKLFLRAATLAKRAMAIGDGAVVARGHRLLSSLLPGYHIAMMNDARRNAAWDRALRTAIRPGMHVLEIGTGAGMLAMMAARAGAARVTTCEKDPVVAALARELVARNGYADRIAVIEKSSHALEIGIDLERPADLLFCDIFGDRLFDFDPLPALADARQRLLAAGAPVVPARGALRVALVCWDEYARVAHIGRVAGFDLAPVADYAVRELMIDIGDPAIRLLSQPQTILSVDFAASSHPSSGRGRVPVEAAADGDCNGIARWIRLELGPQTVLEAAPETGAVFFSRPRFCPFPAPVHVVRCQQLRIETAFRGKQVETWLAR